MNKWWFLLLLMILVLIFVRIYDFVQFQLGIWLRVKQRWERCDIWKVKQLRAWEISEKILILKLFLFFNKDNSEVNNINWKMEVDEINLMGDGGQISPLIVNLEWQYLNSLKIHSTSSLLKIILLLKCAWLKLLL